MHCPPISNPTRKRGEISNTTRKQGKIGNPTRKRGEISNPTRKRGKISNTTRKRGKIGNPTRKQGEISNPTRKQGENVLTQILAYASGYQDNAVFAYASGYQDNQKFAYASGYLFRSCLVLVFTVLMFMVLMLALSAVASAQEVDNATFPPLAPLPAVPIPGDNPVNDAKIELGKYLFFDDRLSGDVGTSCASCHDPRQGWGDGNALSRGYAGTQHWRNSQTIINSAYLSKLFWAGESPSLEKQASSAITGNVAGNGDPAMIEERLAQIPAYLDLFEGAFGVRQPNYELVLRAIATFERTELIANDSPFDEYLAGDKEALSDGALRGLELFNGKANCIRCHNGALMTDEKYHALGLPENALFKKDPLRQITLRFQHYARGVPEEVYRHADTDLGLYYTTKRVKDKGKFRTPPLRYTDYTAPYMHNGAFETLDEVIDFYDEGGGEGPNKSPLLEPLNLTDDEKFDLLEFLESCTGDEVRITPPELPAYSVMGES